MESALNYLGAGNLKGMKVAVQGAGGIGNCFLFFNHNDVIPCMI